MPADYVPQADDPVDGDPVVLRPSTYARHKRAVEYVEQDNRAIYPRPGRGRTTHPAPGAWGYLPAGPGITAASGLTLGHGTVTLCSRSDNTLTADGDNVEAYNTGSAIDGPKILGLEWTAGAWSVCECGGTPIDCINCMDCQIPKKTLRFSYSGGSIALPIWDRAAHGGFNPPGLPAEWDTVAFIFYACLVIGGQAYRIGFGCNPGTPRGHWLLAWGGATGPPSDCNAIANGEYCTVSDGTIVEQFDFTCNPFHAHYQSGCGTLPGLVGGNDFYIDDPGPLTTCPPPHDEIPPAMCSPKILGCNGSDLVGATVVIKDSGGTTLASGTTDSSGIFASGLTAASYWITVSKSRFTTTTFSDFSCSGITALDMSSHVASGYHCMVGCADPVADTLHATHPIFGVQTYTYASSGVGGAGWYMPALAYSYAGCLDCPSKTVTVNSFLLADGTFHDWWNAIGHCPDDGPPGTPTPVQTNWFNDSTSCPPSFSMTFEWTFSEEIQYYLFCTTDTLTIVITE